jgi:hypothetical protein
MLDRAAPRLQNARTEAQAFVSDNNEDHLRNLDAQIDGLLNEMPPFPPLPFKAEAAAAKEATESYFERLLEMETDVRGRLEALHEEIAKASEGISEQVRAAEERLTAVTTAAGDYAARVQHETGERIAEVRAQIEAQVLRLDSAINQMQTTFSEAQERRISEFAESQAKREETFSERFKEVTHSAETRLEQVVADGQASINVLKEQEARAAQIVGITAASTVTGAYMKEADEQRAEADKWRVWALTSAGVLLLYALIVAVFFPPGEDLSASGWLTYWVAKLPLALVIGAVLPYLMRQSAGHRQRERVARRIAMELTAFRPFLSELDDEACRKLIADAQLRFFPGHKLDEASSGTVQ